MSGTDDGGNGLPEVRIPPLPEIPPLPWEQPVAPAEAPAAAEPVPPAPAPASPVAPPAPFVPPSSGPAPAAAPSLAPPMYPSAASSAPAPAWAPPGRAVPPYAVPSAPDADPYGAGQPAAYAYPQPVGYGPPGGATPKRGFPAWGGWLIGGGALVVVGAVVAAGLLSGWFTAGDEETVAGDGESAEPAADGDEGMSTGGDEEEDEAEGGSSPSPDGAIALTETVPGASELGWVGPDTSGDEWEVFYDDNGSFIGILTLDGGGTCSVNAASDVPSEPIDASDDAAATTAHVESYYAQLQEVSDEAAEGDDDMRMTYDVAPAESTAFAAGGQSIEFAGYDVTMTLGDLDGYTERTYWRSFADSGTALSIDVTCTGAEGGTPEADVLAGFSLE